MAKRPDQKTRKKQKGDGAATTAARKNLFLSAYVKHGTISKSCRAANIPRQTFYDWKESDPKFLEAFESTSLEMLDVLAAISFKEAQKPANFFERKWLMSKLKPEMYGERTDVSVSGPVPFVMNFAPEPKGGEQGGGE